MRADADGGPRRRLHHHSPPLPRPPKATRALDVATAPAIVVSWLRFTPSVVSSLAQIPAAKCHNFLSMSPGAESFPPVTTSLSPDWCNYSSSGHPPTWTASTLPAARPPARTRTCSCCPTTANSPHRGRHHPPARTRRCPAPVPQSRRPGKWLTATVTDRHSGGDRSRVRRGPAPRSWPQAGSRAQRRSCRRDRQLQRAGSLVSGRAGDVECSRGPVGYASVAVPLTHLLRQNYKHPDSCIAAAAAQLGTGGHLHVWITARN
jgi:hypothetical protein